MQISVRKTCQAHSLADNKDQRLVADGGGRREEEEGEGDVEEGDGTDDGCS